MNPRNLQNANVSQHQHGLHSDKCGCMQGHHIWDEEFDSLSKHERWCVCCEHFFLSEEAEDEAADNAIDYPGKPVKPGVNPGSTGFSKGKIKRR